MIEMESTFVKVTEEFVVARNNTTTEVHEIMQYQEYSGMYSPTSEIKYATLFESESKAKELAQVLNTLAKFNEATYEYYVLKVSSAVSVVPNE